MVLGWTDIAPSCCQLQYSVVIRVFGVLLGFWWFRLVLQCLRGFPYGVQDVRASG